MSVTISCRIVVTIPFLQSIDCQTASFVCLRAFHLLLTTAADSGCHHRIPKSRLPHTHTFVQRVAIIHASLTSQAHSCIPSVSLLSHQQEQTISWATRFQANDRKVWVSEGQMALASISSEWDGQRALSIFPHEDFGYFFQGTLLAVARS